MAPSDGVPPGAAAAGQSSNHSGGAHRAPPPDRPAERGALAPALRIPLFYKLLLANGIIVITVAGVSAALSRHVSTLDRPESATTPFLLLALGGLLLTLVFNALIVWLALSPVRALEQAAARVRSGDYSARATVTSVANVELERLVGTFNQVLDAVQEQNRRLRELAGRVQTAMEEERQRVARELHDGIAQSLAALTIRVKLARNATDNEVRASVLNEVSGGIADAILELRRMAKGLRPPALETLGLAAAVESHARAVGENCNIVAEITTDNVAGLLAPENELTLYRILQESLSNVVQHSGASRVGVELRRKNGSVLLAIEDDGCGFDTAVVLQADRSLGLFGMKERAYFMGGSLEVSSEVGRGTRVQVTVPVLEGTAHVR